MLVLTKKGDAINILMVQIVFSFLFRGLLIFLIGMSILFILSLFSFKTHKEIAYIYLKEVKTEYYRDERFNEVTFDKKYAFKKGVIIIDDELNELLINIILELYRFRDMIEDKVHKKVIDSLMELFPDYVTYVVKCDGDRVSYTTTKMYSEIYKAVKNLKSECNNCSTPRAQLSDMIKKAEFIMGSELYCNSKRKGRNKK